MRIIQGNLLDLAEQGHFNIIIHGANCQNTMGSGIAKQIKDRYPKAYLVDKMTKKGDATKLGKFTQAYIDGFNVEHGVPNTTSAGSVRKVPYHFTIINAYTQYDYGTNTQQVSYTALADVFKQIKMLYDMNPQPPCRIGIPMIGAGLAGGDWNKIEEIIDDIGFSDITCVIYKEK